MKVATLIIDASVAFKWLVAEPDSDAARDLLSADDLAAPTLIFSEVGNAIAKRLRSGAMVDAEGRAGVFVANLGRLLTIVDEREYMPRSMALALALKHPVHDCLYLAIAEAMDRKLVTADKKFFGKLTSAGFSNHARLLGP